MRSLSPPHLNRFGLIHLNISQYIGRKSEQSASQSLRETPLLFMIKAIARINKRLFLFFGKTDMKIRSRHMRFAALCFIVVLLCGCFSESAVSELILSPQSIELCVGDTVFFRRGARRDRSRRAFSPRRRVFLPRRKRNGGVSRRRKRRFDRAVARDRKRPRRHARRQSFFARRDRDRARRRRAESCAFVLTDNPSFCYTNPVFTLS